MSLSDLAALGSFVSGLAVLVSLVFLYFQLRQIGAQIQQTEKNQKAAIGQGRTNRVVEVAMMTADPSLSEAIAKTLTNASDLTPQQLFQYLQYTRAMFLNAEDTFYQHASGLLEEEPYQGFVGAMRLTVGYPSARVMWQSQRMGYGAAFVQFVDKLIEETPQDPVMSPEERLALWKTAMAAMMTSPGRVVA